MSSPLADAILNNLVERTSVHDVLHSLIELCYRRAWQEERTFNRAEGEHWKQLGQMLTSAESYVGTVMPKEERSANHRS